MPPPSPHFQISPENFWLWFGGVWLAVGLPFLGIGIYAAYDQFSLNQRFETQALTVRGMVLTKAVHKSTKSGDISYTVTFRFSRVGGESTQSGAGVSKAEWNALDERGLIDVRYLPEWPHPHRVAGQDPQDKFWLAAVFLGLGTILSAGGGFAVAWHARRKRVEGAR